ncbi:MAG TPA: FKBP-type peptidyl-prolyl cis-trans isomerase [Pedobacter sp.]|nr:FKBP-type peptidyl-prolyl cis-trans isomerase [Pedobacter sp.]
MLRKLSSYTFVLLGLITVLSSCKKEYESAENIDNAKIAEYLAKNNVTATKDPDGTGFYYQVTNPATGEFFKNTDSVLYSITIKSLLNGTTYYTSPEWTNQGTYVGYTTSAGALKLPGLLTVLHLLKPGGVGRLILPSYLAYGKNGSDVTGVPSNELIDFTITTYPETKQADLDDRRIRDFIAAKGLTAAKDDETGVYYVVTNAGAGDAIDMTSTLTLNYTGRLFNGTGFDSSTDGTYKTSLPEAVAGFEVVKNFRKGAKVRLLIPSVQGYGTAGNGSAVQPNTNLDFDVEIIEVVN